MTTPQPAPGAPDIDAIVERVQNQVAVLDQALGDLQGVRGRASSPDGLVTAEVDGNGALVGLWIDDAVARHDAAHVAMLVTQTASRAAADASAHREQLMATFADDFADPPR
ncbi:YbaB/EbfC family DNA-binding protein [Rhodococcus rhodnii]|uniref:Nucleoid-associated protein YbaB n=2 Tax=Rhodococcus rhodnii TaxID=38312 RepID=R7WJH6_9NOCA|nr:YbaB/EbfC family nucleoid-associated protein [Rhodococcus rhodnii]EOM75442.1 hypothetical protein Rrhod_3240 [Rhodococcus rhodnii LMG 5362]TXG90532.1 YbaB/EbfC family DNA-binding protein [Rhodococcus rhodnii]